MDKSEILKKARNQKDEREQAIEIKALSAMAYTVTALIALAIALLAVFGNLRGELMIEYRAIGFGLLAIAAAGWSVFGLYMGIKLKKQRRIISGILYAAIAVLTVVKTILIIVSAA